MFAVLTRRVRFETKSGTETAPKTIWLLFLSPFFSVKGSKTGYARLLISACQSVNQKIKLNAKPTNHTRQFTYAKQVNCDRRVKKKKLVGLND